MAPRARARGRGTSNRGTPGRYDSVLSEHLVHVLTMSLVSEVMVVVVVAKQSQLRWYCNSDVFGTRYVWFCRFDIYAYSTF